MGSPASAPFGPMWAPLGAAMPPGGVPYHLMQAYPSPVVPPGMIDPRLLAQAPGGSYPYPGAMPPSAWAGQAWGAPPPGAGMAPPASPLAALMQALQTGEVPRVAGVAPPAARAPSAPQGEPTRAPARDATALLSLILSNAQVQDTLRRAATQRVPDDVQLAVPASTGSTRRDVVPLPMNAVVQAIASLAQRSTLELDEALTDEDESAEAPAEFLLTEGGDLIVDPADPHRRADLVAHYFRCAAEAERRGF